MRLRRVPSVAAASGLRGGTFGVLCCWRAFGCRCCTFSRDGFRGRFSRCRCSGGRCACGELVRLHGLVDDNCEVAAGCVDDCGDAGCRRVDEEEELGEELFLARQRRQVVDLCNVDNLAVNDTELEGELRVVLDPG